MLSVCEDVGDDKYIVTSDALAELELTFAGLESDDRRIYEIISSQIAGISNIRIGTIVVTLLSLLIKGIAYRSDEIVISRMSDNTDRTEGFKHSDQSPFLN